MAQAAKTVKGSGAYAFMPTKGALVVGNAVLELDANKWYLVSSKAAVSTLPAYTKPGSLFKAPISTSPIVPAVGDNVYPIDLSDNTKVCWVSISNETSKGSIDITDSCKSGSITDGIVTMTGSIQMRFKLNTPSGGITTAQKEIINKYFDIVSDDGAGGYTYALKNDTDLIIAMLVDPNYNEEGMFQTWLLFSAVLTSLSLNFELTAVVDLTANYSQGEDVLATVYQRELNSEDETNLTNNVF